MQIKNVAITLAFLLLSSFSFSKTSEDYLIEGNFYFQRNEYDIAIEKYKQALKINPKDARANYNLGVAYYKKGADFYKDAILSYKKAIEIDPKMTDAYFNLGVVYFSLGDYVKAEENLRKAKEIDPSDKTIADAIKIVEARKREIVPKKQDDIIEIKIKKEEKPKTETQKKDAKISHTTKNQQAETNYEIVICKNVINRNPKDETKIFTSQDEKVVVWVNFKKVFGKKTFTVRWIAPDGKLENTYQYEFTSSGRYRVWAERKIKGSKMGDTKGTWKVEILLDDDLIATRNFEIK